MILTKYSLFILVEDHASSASGCRMWPKFFGMTQNMLYAHQRRSIHSASDYFFFSALTEMVRNAYAGRAEDVRV